MILMNSGPLDPKLTAFFRDATAGHSSCGRYLRLRRRRQRLLRRKFIAIARLSSFPRFWAFVLHFCWCLPGPTQMAIIFYILLGSIGTKGAREGPPTCPLLRHLRTGGDSSHPGARHPASLCLQGPTWTPKSTYHTCFRKFRAII